MKSVGFWSGVSLSYAARVSDNGVMSSKSTSEGLTMFQQVSAANAHLSVDYMDFSETDPTGCHWNPTLGARYHDEFVVGTGATACVFLATDGEGATVAIKVAKQAGRDAMWRAECSDMQNLRIEACAAGQQFQENAERYLPTCV